MATGWLELGEEGTTRNLASREWHGRRRRFRTRGRCSPGGQMREPAALAGSVDASIFCRGKTGGGALRSGVRATEDPVPMAVVEDPVPMAAAEDPVLMAAAAVAVATIAVAVAAAAKRTEHPQTTDGTRGTE
mmetsp:Transcript_29663/g.74126  ORF Transcript_29663/g.74126 Transcript_29663/m.74126 type:complete len:132 (-) Transcript_29663:287-682(-)